MIFDIKYRSEKREILDDIDENGYDLSQNLRELALINRKLGGHKIVIDSLREILKPRHDKEWKIVDMGCGGGDALAAIARNPELTKFKKKLKGVDVSARALHFAKQEYSAIPNLEFVQADILQQWPDEKFDVVCFNLILHHFTDEQIISLLKKAAKNSDYLLISDLQRNWIPYHLFRLVSWVFRFSVISRNDGKISVQKSFTREDWDRILNKAGLKSFTIGWRWAFRWVAIIHTKDYRD